MLKKYRCMLCEKEENKCQCDVKDYCVLCLGADDVHLCEDGQYYCRICREACDFQAQDDTSSF